MLSVFRIEDVLYRDDGAECGVSSLYDEIRMYVLFVTVVVVLPRGVLKRQSHAEHQVCHSLVVKDLCRESNFFLGPRYLRWENGSGDRSGVRPVWTGGDSLLIDEEELEKSF